MSLVRPRLARAATYLVDTNIYVRAFREADFGERFRKWHAGTIGRLAMSVVVLHELLIGAIDERRRHILERAYASELRQRTRLLVPSASVWSKMVEADRQIRALGSYNAKLEHRSFANDLLIALTCREIGAVLITANTNDFELIHSVTGVRYLSDLPEAD